AQEVDDVAGPDAAAVDDVTGGVPRGHVPGRVGVAADQGAGRIEVADDLVDAVGGLEQTAAHAGRRRGGAVVGEGHGDRDGEATRLVADAVGRAALVIDGPGQAVVIQQEEHVVRRAAREVLEAGEAQGDGAGDAGRIVVDDAGVGAVAADAP